MSKSRGGRKGGGKNGGDDIASNFVEVAKETLIEGLTAYGNQAVLDIQETLSIPYPPPSVPGEAPHMRTGALVDGVTSFVDVTDQSVELNLVSERNGSSQVPTTLEFDLDRPYMGPARLKAESDLFGFLSGK